MKIVEFFLIIGIGKIVLAGAGARIFEKLEPEPHKNGPAPQHCLETANKYMFCLFFVPVPLGIVPVPVTIKKDLIKYLWCRYFEIYV
jgi:hypothetical protein